MTKKLSEIIDEQDFLLFQDIATRFSKEYEPHNSMHGLAKFMIFNDWKKYILIYMHASEGNDDLYDEDLLYLLGTLYRLIEFGSDDKLRLGSRQVPRFIGAFEKILLSIDENNLTTYEIGGQQHSGSIIGPFGRLDEAKEWLDQSKEELRGLGYNV